MEKSNLKKEFNGIVTEIYDDTFEAKIYKKDTNELVYVNKFYKKSVNINDVKLGATFSWVWGEENGVVFSKIEFDKVKELTEEEKTEKEKRVNAIVEDLITIFK